MYINFFKRLLDFLFACFGIVVLSPVFLVIVIALYKSNEGKPFFIQERPGEDGKIFKLIKFKTMNDKKDSEGNLLPMGERITPLGRFLRKTSLDEIPQLFNVIKGDMSLMGPRPLLKEYLPMYTDRQQERHSVRPGITGWAQVNGRNQVTWKDKFEMDIWYVDNISFKLDAIIFFKTIKKIITKSDVADIELAVTQQDFLD